METDRTKHWIVEQKTMCWSKSFNFLNWKLIQKIVGRYLKTMLKAGKGETWFL